MLNILFASPDLVYSASLKNILEQEGYHVIFLGARIDPAILSSDEKADLIILDFVPTEDNPEEMCRQIRAATPAPLVFITPLHDRTQTRLLLTSGADRVISKSSSSRELLAQIGALLRRVTLNRSGYQQE